MRLSSSQAEQHPILKFSVNLLLPFILMFALYVQFHGDYGPGGGFQAGVIFASGIFLHALVYGLEHTRRAIQPIVLRFLMPTGALIFAGTGLVAMLNGGQFLNYSVLMQDPHYGQHYGIIVIEFGVGLTVASVMITLYYAFVGRRLRRGNTQ